jgi:hypothetical protein
MPERSTLRSTTERLLSRWHAYIRPEPKNKGDIDLKVTEKEEDERLRKREGVKVGVHGMGTDVKESMKRGKKYGFGQGRKKYEQGSRGRQGRPDGLREHDRNCLPGVLC